MFDSVSPTLPTRDRLIQAAAELMYRQSYGAVSVDDICREADIKKGTFYHHFASKNELALATFTYMWGEYRAEIEATQGNQEIPPTERLARYVDSIVACHRETFAAEGKVYGCPLCTAGQEMGAQDEAIRQKIASIYEEVVDLFTELVKCQPAFAHATEEQSRETARAILSYTSGVEAQAKVANDPEVIARDLLPGLKRLIAMPLTE